MVFKLTLEGGRDTRGRIAKVTNMLYAWQKAVLKSGGEKMLKELKARAPVGKSRKHVRDAYKMTFMEGRDQVGIEIINTSDHFVFAVGPTRPHIIRPKRKKVLRFTVGGQVVFAKEVHHPGTKKNTWNEDVIAAQRGEFEIEARRLARQIQVEASK